MGRPVIVVGYNRAWPAQFEAMRRTFVRVLGDVALRIEHVGSTSVPGLAAKPILDIDVVIESPARLPAAVDRLADLDVARPGSA